MTDTTSPARPDFRRAASRFAALLLIAAPALLTAGCSWFQRPELPFEPPQDLARAQDLVPVQKGDYSTEALCKAYPELNGFGLSSSVIAERKVFFKPVSMKLLVSYITNGPRESRLLARHPADQTNVFEIIINHETMSVMLPLEKSLFVGPTPDGETPFGGQFGVEPWDLLSMIAIGQRVAQSGPYCAPGPRKTVVFPGASDQVNDGLQKVNFDTATGLPRSAIWRRHGRELRVDYLRWRIEDETETGRVYPLPEKLIISHPKPKGKILIDVRQYNALNPPPNGQRYQCPDPGGLRVYPIEQFDKVLTGG